MDDQLPKEIVRSFFEDVFNKHDLNAADHYLAPDFVWDSANTIGRAPFKAFFQGGFAGLGNYRVTINQLIAEADRVVVYNTIEGNHTGPMLGYPPTNQPVRYDANDIYKVQNGQLTEHWAVVDIAGLQRQLRSDVYANP